MQTIAEARPRRRRAHYPKPPRSVREASRDFTPDAIQELPDTYQYDLVRLLFRDRAFSVDFSRWLNPFEHLDHPHVQWASHLCVLWWERHTKPPTLDNVKDGLPHRVRRKEFPDSFAHGLCAFFENVVMGDYTNDPGYIKEQAQKWLKRQIQLGIHRDLRIALEEGDAEEVDRLYTQGAAVSFQEDMEKEDLAKDVEISILRRNREAEEKIPWGCGFDGAMGGGLRRHNLHLIGAPSDAGKTTMATYIGGYVVEQMECVLHISLESSRGEVVDRYDSRFARVDRNQLVWNADAVRAGRARVFPDGRSLLHVYRWAPYTLTPAMVDALVQQLHAEGVYPTLLIIDSPDEMIPWVGYDEGLYLQANIIYNSLIGVLVRHNMAGVITTQTKTETFGAEFIRLNECSDSINKARRAHSVMFMSQTDRMKTASPYSYVLGILAKQKEGPTNLVSPMQAHYAQSTFTPVPEAQMRAELGSGYQVVAVQ